MARLFPDSLKDEYNEKMKYLGSFVIAIFFLCAVPAEAFLSEVGVSYMRRKTTFNADNYTESESTTGSYSIYLYEFLALEMSYTSATAQRMERASDLDPRRSVEQITRVLGADLIVVLASKSAPFQPYIKAGAAEITRNQKISYEGGGESVLEPEKAVVPSYGLGLKIGLTQSFNVKMSYEIWKTPIGGGLNTDDSAIRVGLSWYL